MTRTQARATAFLVVLSIFLLPLLTLAQGIPTIVPQQCNEAGGCKSICDIAQLAQNILNAAIYLGVILAAILFAWAGWGMLTAGGNSEKYSGAKKTLVNIFVGLVIILTGWIVMDTLMKSVMDTGKFGPWNKVCRNG